MTQDERDELNAILDAPDRSLSRKEQDRYDYLCDRYQEEDDKKYRRCYPYFT